MTTITLNGTRIPVVFHTAHIIYMLHEHLKACPCVLSWLQFSRVQYIPQPLLLIKGTLTDPSQHSVAFRVKFCKVPSDPFVTCCFSNQGSNWYASFLVCIKTELLENLQKVMQHQLQQMQPYVQLKSTGPYRVPDQNLLCMI